MAELGPAQLQLVINIFRKRLFVGTLQANKKLFAGTLPENKKLFAGTLPANKKLFAEIPNTLFYLFLLFASQMPA